MGRADMDRVFNKDVDAVPDPGIAPPAEASAPTEPPAPASDEGAKSTPSRVTFDVTPELHRAYRVWTLTNGTTMKDHLTAYIKQSIGS
ncbi:partitioning protein [Clavibacter sepedonicus]|uniref:Uncharacterized protein n=1 Tax=Clavibacter sepedonicus TaxID=31964 RepID=B0RJ01_CLASE|nr:MULTISPECIES: hypothetical protein [Clavibacter]OQJ45053.1 partitioning protein [Clavibacter sepedonicus]OQJ50924.1 partitioning protein [Clavibacter sepedonicus]UUK67273.1 partitioning protein [Clavibacter sepedonicus]CAQ03189.1 hypothetical protein pCS0006 [Clavibacter sepedonicus]